LLVRKIVAAGIAVGFACAGQAKSWDLAGDWPNTGVNPNGVWTYGELTANPPTVASFVPLTNMGNGGYLGSSEYGANNTVLIYKPTSQSGIIPGQVDLNASDAAPDARWTSPIRGTVTITAEVGGPSGNGFANLATLDLNGMAQTGTFNSPLNTMTWTITDVPVTPGENLDLYVPDPGPPPNPNTQAILHIAFVTPEPAPFAVFGLGALGLLIRRRRR
jgi:hypothetical protein